MKMSQALVVIFQNKVRDCWNLGEEQIILDECLNQLYVKYISPKWALFFCSQLQTLDNNYATGYWNFEI